MKILIQEIYERFETRFYLQEVRGDQTVIIGYDGKKLVEHVISNYEVMCNDIKPLFVCRGYNMRDNIIKAFVSLGADNNIRTENENLLQGKLKATGLHLSDMRELSTKLIDKIIINNETT